MPPHTHQIALSGPAETSALARALAPRLHPGDTLLLSGPVGAGKSHFARSLISALLPAPEDIPSPTYTLVQTYQGTTGEIWHADLYRLGDVSEIEELGLNEAFETAVCLVEWPDRLGELAPAGALLLAFHAPAADDTRELTLTWTGARWSALVQEVCA